MTAIMTDLDFDEMLEQEYPDQAEFMATLNERLGLDDDLDKIKDAAKRLSDELDINTSDSFEDNYYYETDHYDPCTEFAEHYVMEMCDGERLLNDAGMMPWLIGCIDYEAVWKSALQYDFTEWEFEGVTYFFLNH